MIRITGYRGLKPRESFFHPDLKTRGCQTYQVLFYASKTGDW